MSAVDDALAELKKAEEALLAAKAVDASTLPKADVDPAPAVVDTPLAEKSGTTADASLSTVPAVAAVPAVVHSHEIKLGPTDVHGS